MVVEVSPERRRIVRPKRRFDSAWLVAVASAGVAALAVLGCGVLGYQVRVATTERDLARQGLPFPDAPAYQARIAGLEEALRLEQAKPPVQVVVDDEARSSARIKSLYALSVDLEAEVVRLKAAMHAAGCIDPARVIRR